MFMTEQTHRDDTVFVEIVAVVCAIVFVVVMFFKFVDWMGPYSGALSSPEVGKDVLPVK
jgi:hypothetical protein